MTGHFFEGAEKLLEIWFVTSENESGKATTHNDLRNIPRDLIEDVLSLVNCKVLTYAQSATTDTYVLSESSMFVFQTHFILKTCGETTLLHAVQPMLDLARDYCGLDIVDQIFYSRRKFLRPELQKAPHTSFEHEVAYLDSIFEGGSAYVLGRTNVDCWYLYTLDRTCVSKKSDQTLEIIMTDLDPEKMKIFYQEYTSSAAEATKKAGIDKLFPNAKIFDYLFDPCGYSMNGLLPDGHYFTIHITPEPDFSYVSFETNVSYSQYQELIRKILQMFNPGKFTTTIFGGTLQVSMVNENYSIFLTMAGSTIKLSVWLITILFTAITKNTQAEDSATPSACVVKKQQMKINSQIISLRWPPLIQIFLKRDLVRLRSASKKRTKKLKLMLQFYFHFVLFVFFSIFYHH
ncbi:unnamed protein product [Adineta ricciae]|uniref:Adenosylmethionine decarboxylase n=1 Tax=Adineta ricciae TaxID=249248 RepID=A0A814WM76_ADIRI|nr:unnamed protein product [Adineta ricciae]